MIKMSKKSLLKICGLTLLFLLALFFLFPPETPLTSTHDHVHENNVTITENKDNNIKTSDPEIDNDIEGYVKDILALDKEHSSALSDKEMTDRLEKICIYYQDICEKISWDAGYSASQKYMYSLLMIYSVKKMDSQRELPTPNTLRNTISRISMVQSNQGRRGSAGTTHVKMNTQKIDSYKEFREVWIHEVGGHIQDLGVITDQYSSTLHQEYTEFGEPKFGLNDRSLKFYRISRLDENTRKQDASYKDFVSGYAMKDTFEELAEFTNAWINHHDLLIELTKKNNKMKQKYVLFQELFGNRYFDADSGTLDAFNADERVFDSTKSWKNK